MYYSERVPVALEELLGKRVETANQWFNDKGIIVNETKHEALILADTDRILVVGKGGFCNRDTGTQ